MYRYDDIDQRLVDERVAQFRDQTRRFLAGELTRGRVPAAAAAERPVHPAPRADAARRDSVRPAVVARSCASSRTSRATTTAATATSPRARTSSSTGRGSRTSPTSSPSSRRVEMHAIQTSGNCVRNITTDHFAGVARGRDRRSAASGARSCASGRRFHPEFAYLPRKFKIAVTGAADRPRRDLRFTTSACTRVRERRRRDRLPRDRRRRPGPHADHRPRDPRVPAVAAPAHLPRSDPARLQPLRPPRQHLQGAHQDPGQGARRRKSSARGRSGMGAPARTARRRCPRRRSSASQRASPRPAYERLPERRRSATRARSPTTARSPPGRSATSTRTRCRATRAVTLSLKKTGVPPGDVDRRPDGRGRRPRRPLQLRRAARHARAEPGPRRRAQARSARAVAASCSALGLATPNIGLLTDIIACPGGDFCSLANAQSIPIAEAIQRRFDDLDYLYDIGELDLNISGCMNACGHHHVGHIGILGVDKNGEEFYQISIGGNQARRAGRRGRARQGHRPVVLARARCPTRSSG